MEIKFNIKGVTYGVILILFIVLGFVFIPKLFMDTSKPVDFTMVQRESIPEKILDIMDKYENEERALAVKLDNKIYVIVTRGEKEHGIESDKIGENGYPAPKTDPKYFTPRIETRRFDYNRYEKVFNKANYYKLPFTQTILESEKALVQNPGW